MLLDLYCDGIGINWKATDKVVSHWNSLVTPDINNTFSRITGSRTGPQYMMIGIVITHLINYRIERDINKLFNAIDRLFKLPWYVPKIFNNKKAHLFLFFTDVFNRNYLDAFFEKDVTKFKNFIYYYKPTYDKAFNHFEKMFINTLYPNKPEKGEQAFKRSRNFLAKWFDEMSHQVLNGREWKRDLCGLKWIASNKKHNLNSIVQEYLIWLTTIKKFPTPRDIDNPSNWQNFVINRMRNEYGYKNFWKYVN
jgi:hypothetical protein